MNFCVYTCVSKNSQGSVKKNIIVKDTIGKEVGKVCWQQKIPADPYRNMLPKKKKKQAPRKKFLNIPKNTDKKQLKIISDRWLVNLVMFLFK